MVAIYTYGRAAPRGRSRPQIRHPLYTAEELSNKSRARTMVVFNCIIL